jgi:pyoverdine/dityrosine biosynthesis protein Dit1
MNSVIVYNILDVFQDFRMAPLPTDQFDSVGKAVLADKMSPFVGANKPVKFVMLGYPMKSPNNRDKVIGTMPDLAEEVSLNNFRDFSNRVKEVYSPGVEISIVSDGYVFNDIMDVSDNTVALYNEMSMDMVKGAQINWFQMNDFYKESSLATMRAKITSQFGITPEVLQQRILMDADVNSLYRGMIKFMTEDLAMKNFASNTQLQKQAKITAKEMMFRNEAYSSLIRNEFPDNIRLSMHPSVNNGTKFSFQLIPSKNAWTSPWHCALLVNNGEYETIHRKDAIAAGYELVSKDGRPSHFVK